MSLFLLYQQKFKIDEQSSIVLTLEDDVTQLNDNLTYLKKEGMYVGDVWIRLGNVMYLRMYVYT